MLTSRSHAIVLQPKLEDIPDGDWYCYECISKATGDQHCVVCGRRLGKMLSCYNCHRIQHLDCTQPPLQRTPKRWACAVCIHTGKVLALAVTSYVSVKLCAALTSAMTCAQIAHCRIRFQCKAAKRPRKRKTSAAASDKSEDESIGEAPPPVADTPTKPAEESAAFSKSGEYLPLAADTPLHNIRVRGVATLDGV